MKWNSHRVISGVMLDCSDWGGGLIGIWRWGPGRLSHSLQHPVQPHHSVAQQSPEGDALAEDTHPPEFNLINCVLFSHRGFRAEQTF